MKVCVTQNIQDRRAWKKAMVHEGMKAHKEELRFIKDVSELITLTGEAGRIFGKMISETHPLYYRIFTEPTNTDQALKDQGGRTCGC